MYKLGDYIKIGDVEGTVEDINLLSTKVRTLDDFVINIPNNNISSATIINLSKAKKRRINELFNVTYSTSDEKLLEATKRIERELVSRLKELHDNGKLLEEQRLKERTMYDLEMLKEQ